MAVFPNKVFVKEDIKFRWEERYTSEGINKKFLGIPRGVYLGFIPVVTPPTTLVLQRDANQKVSLIRVEGGDLVSNPAAPAMVDIITTSDVTLDFSGHSTWPVYVIATASFLVGDTSSGQLITRTTPASGPKEVNVCKVDRPGNTGNIVITPSTVFPTNDITARQEPYAFTGQTFGFMPSGSKENLDTALLTANEVIAARQKLNGIIAPTFDIGFPQTTGLPKRLADDLSAQAVAGRLGNQLVNVRSNSYPTPGPLYDVTLTPPASGYNIGSRVTINSGAGLGTVRDIVGAVLTISLHTGVLNSGDTFAPISPDVGSSGNIAGITVSRINISGSFSAKRRFSLSSNFPVIDGSGGTTLGTDKPIGIPTGGTEDYDPTLTGVKPITGAIVSTSVNGFVLTLSAITGTFIPGEKITGTSAGPPVGLLHDTNYPTFSGTMLSGTFTNSETITGALSGATATVTAAVIPSVNDTVRNVCYINKFDTGERLIDAGINYANGFSPTILGIPVWGRLELKSNDLLPESINFVQGTNTVAIPSTSDWTSLKKKLGAGDIVLAPDGRYYEITSISETLQQFVIHQNYLGTTALATTNTPRRSIWVRLVRKNGSTEEFVGFSGATALSLQFFYPVWFSLERSVYNSELQKFAAGDPILPDATTTIKGKVELAANLENAANVVVQGNDDRVNSPIQGVTIPGRFTHVQAGTNVVFSPSGSNLIINVPTGGTGGTGPTGPPGPGFNNFQYGPVSPILSAGPISYSISTSFAPRFAFVSISYFQFPGPDGGAASDILDITGITHGPGNSASVIGSFSVPGSADTNIKLMLGAAG